MPEAHRSSAPGKGRRRTGLPLTVSRPALLEGGSDDRFRRLVYDLFTVAARMDEVRAVLAARLAITPPQYNVLMAIAHLAGEGGVPVRDVARRLHVSGAFVTTEVRRLAARGLVEKRANPADGRSVLLALSDRARRDIVAVAPHLRAVNDRFFGGLSADEFRTLSRLAAAVVDGGEAARALVRDGAEAPRARPR